MRNQQLERSLRLLRLLQRGRITLRSCATALGVSPRTIRRDLEVLSVTGFPIQRMCENGNAFGVIYFFIDDSHCPLCDRPDVPSDVTPAVHRTACP